MIKHRFVGPAFCLMAAVLCTAFAAADEPPADGGPVEYGPGRQIAEVTSPEITESSGIAASHRTPDVFWTHNDSGDKPRIFAISKDGRLLGQLSVTGASARDWEDMASFTMTGAPFLLIADVGDNAVKRDKYLLFILPEPATPVQKAASQPADSKPTAQAMRIEFTYEDGPHNCEAVAVDATRNEILIITKCKPDECKAYVLPLPQAAPAKPLVAKPVAPVKMSTATGMDISPDGLRLVVCNYSEAWEYHRTAKEDWPSALARAPRKIRLPHRKQGESICYGRDGVTLYLTSEGSPMPLYEVAAKTDSNKH